MAGEIDIIVAKKAIEELNKAVKGVDAINNSIIALSKNVRELNTTFSQIKTPKGLETRLKKNADAQKKVKENVDKVRLAEIRLQQQREKAFDKFTAGLERQRKARLRETDAIDRNKKALDRQRQAALRNNTAFGRLNRTLSKFALAIGLTSGIFLFIRALRDAVKTVIQFNKQTAVLASVLQKTRKEIRPLIKNAKELGATTAKTANEIVKLQVAYARLGFTQEEIIDLTEATIEGSIALNAELEETAQLTGAVVNSMDALSTTDAPRIMDIMALSTAKSALNFEKLSTGLPIVLGAANALEVQFTKVVAILGKLADAGIETSTAATSLRNIFIESAKQGIDFEKALDKIRVSQNKLTTANEIFGKRAAVSALVIANNVKGVKEFDEALQDAAGTAKEMADVQLDTLSGSLTLLSSAWDGFILSVEDGEGSFSKSIRGMINSLTSLFNSFTDINEVTDVLSGKDLRRTGAEGFLGIPFLSFIKNSAKASAQLKLLNQDFKELRTAGVEELADAYQFYDKLLTKTTDPIHAKLMEFQLERIVELTVARRKANIEEEKVADALFEQRESIIDVLIEIDKELDARELQKLSLKELNAILNQYNEDNEDGNKFLEGSVGFLNEIIKANNKLILQATDRTTIEKLQEENRLLEQQKRLLLEGVRPTVSAIQTVAAGPTGIDTTLADTTLQQDIVSASAFELALGDINNFVDTYGEQINKAIDITNSFFDNRIERIQQDIDANNEFFANQIALAADNEAEQIRLEEERQRKDAELQKKLQKERNKQAIINKAFTTANIVLNTSNAIVAALAPPPIGLGPVAGIPLAISTGILGAAQLAVALSTPVPKFAEGGDVDKDTLGVLGDAGVHEYLERGNTIFQSPDTDTLVNLKSGDKIHKDLDSLAVSKGYDLDAINKAAVMTSIFNDGMRLNAIQLENAFNASLDKYQGQISREIKRGFKGLKNVNNNVTNFDHSIYKQETL